MAVKNLFIKYFPFILIIVTFILYSSLGGPITGDGEVRFQSLMNLLSTGHFDNSKYSFIMPIFSIPFVLLDSLIGFFTHNNHHFFAKRFNLFLLFSSFIPLYFLLKKFLSQNKIQVFFLFILFSNMISGNIFNYYGEMFTIVTTTIGIILLINPLNNKYSNLITYLILAIATANSPAVIIGLLLVSLLKVYETKQYRHLLMVVLAGLIIIAEDLLRRQGQSGYEGDGIHFVTSILPNTAVSGFNYPFFFGFISIIFSFGKGLIFHFPMLVMLPVFIFLIKGKNENETIENKILNENIFFKKFLLYSLLYTFGLILVYSKWWAWYGGWIWGPRFFAYLSLPMAALSCYFIFYLPKKFIYTTVFLFLSLISFWVSFNGLSFWGQAQDQLKICQSYQYEFLCWYTPQFSALWNPFVSSSHYRLNSPNLTVLILHIIAFIYLFKDHIIIFYKSSVVFLQKFSKDIKLFKF